MNLSNIFRPRSAAAPAATVDGYDGMSIAALEALNVSLMAKKEEIREEQRGVMAALRAAVAAAEKSRLATLPPGTKPPIVLG